MKNTLKTFLILGLAITVAMPFSAKADEEDHQRTLNEMFPQNESAAAEQARLVNENRRLQNEQLRESLSRGRRDDARRERLDAERATKEAEAAEQAAQEKAKQIEADKKETAENQERENNAAADLSGMISDRHYHSALANTNIDYKFGKVSVSQEYLKSANKSMMGDTMTQVANIGQAAATETSDPRVGGIVGATTTGIAATGTFINGFNFRNIAARHYEASSRNQQAADHNLNQLNAYTTAQTKLDTRLNENKITAIQHKAGTADLNKEKIMLNAQYLSQKKAASSQYWSGFGNNMTFYANSLGAAAMGWMAQQQYKMGKELSTEQSRCAEDPTAFGCEGSNGLPDDLTNSDCSDPVARVINPDCQPKTPIVNNNPLPTDPGFQTPVAFDGDNEGFNSGSGFNTAGQGGFGGGAGLGSAKGSAPGFLGSGSGLNASNASGVNADGSAADQGKFGPDVEYGSAGGGSSDGNPMVSFDMGGGSAGGFGGGFGDDFSLDGFLPDFLRGPASEKDEFLMAQVNKKKRIKKQMVLGKDSPSLFTRVRKAYQKKAPQMKEEVL